MFLMRYVKMKDPIVDIICFKTDNRDIFGLTTFLTYYILLCKTIIMRNVFDWFCVHVVNDKKH